MTTENEKYLTTPEIAERLRVDARTVANWRVAMRGPLFKKFGVRVVYPLSELLRWEADPAKYEEQARKALAYR